MTDGVTQERVLDPPATPLERALVKHLAESLFIYEDLPEDQLELEIAVKLGEAAVAVIRDLDAPSRERFRDLADELAEHWAGTTHGTVPNRSVRLRTLIASEFSDD